MTHNLQKRKGNRLKGFDYNSAGVYFLTVCTKERQCLLSKISNKGGESFDVTNRLPEDFNLQSVGTDVLDGPCVELTQYGQIADKYIRQISSFYDDISVDAYVIMPNHIHILLSFKDLRTVEDVGPYGRELHILQNTGENVPAQKTVTARFISIFKRFCNKEYGENIWQSRSHDHIVRDQKDYDSRMVYICKNPMNWYYDELYSQ